MSTAVISVNAATMDQEDRRAARMAIARKNEQIAFQNQQINAQNAQRALNEPPLTPLPLIPLLPSTTGADLKNGLEVVLAESTRRELDVLVQQANEQALQANLPRQIREKLPDATPAKQQAILDLLNAP